MREVGEVDPALKLVESVRRQLQVTFRRLAIARFRLLRARRRKQVELNTLRRSFWRRSKNLWGRFLAALKA